MNGNRLVQLKVKCLNILYFQIKMIKKAKMTHLMIQVTSFIISQFHPICTLIAWDIAHAGGRGPDTARLIQS